MLMGGFFFFSGHAGLHHLVGVRSTFGRMIAEKKCDGEWRDWSFSWVGNGREGRDGLWGWTWPTRIDGGGEASFLKLG